MIGKSVFPFSTLNPNAGAQLRSEILFLPHIALSSSLGDVNSSDQCVIDAACANPILESIGTPPSSGTSSPSAAENLHQIAPYFI